MEGQMGNGGETEGLAKHGGEQEHVWGGGNGDGERGQERRRHVKGRTDYEAATGGEARTEDSTVESEWAGYGEREGHRRRERRELQTTTSTSAAASREPSE
eukprot:6674454-Pyramimonas_sp.AAC.1